MPTSVVNRIGQYETRKLKDRLKYLHEFSAMGERETLLEIQMLRKLDTERAAHGRAIQKCMKEGTTIAHERVRTALEMLQPLLLDPATPNR